MSKVFKELYDARIKWYSLGLELEMNHSTLVAIRMKHNNSPDECFSDMLSTWLKSSKPTLTKLVSALKSPTVGFECLANKLCPNHTVSDVQPIQSPQPSTETHSNVFQCPCRRCNLLDYLYKGCPKATSSSYPYLQLDGLTVNDRKNFVQRLSNETSKIVKEFADLRFNTRESLQKRDIPVEDLVCVTFDLQPHISDLDQAKSIVQAFIILRKHMNFFNHEILGHIVEKLGDSDDKENYEQFRSKFKVFCGRRIFEISPSVYSTGQYTKNSKLFVVTNKFIKSLREVKEAHEKVASLLGLNASQVQLERVDEGSVILVFSMPMKLSEDVFPIKQAVHEELMSCGYTLLEPSMSQTEVMCV